MKKNLNILLIFTDEQLWNTLGIYGNKNIHTPNLDRLAKEGAVFHNAICPQPLCTPARASLLTGTYPHTHNAIDNGHIPCKEIPTLAELLRPHGYHCGYIGKWHLGNKLHPQRGFEEFWRSAEDCYATSEDREKAIFSSYHHFLVSNGFLPNGDEKRSMKYPSFSREEAARMPERFSKPAFLALQAEEFFRRYHDDKFFLTVSFLEPHPPYFGPFDDLYPPQKLPANYNDTENGRYPPHIMRRIKNFMSYAYQGVKTSDREEMRKLIARYYGLITLVDKYIGAIIKSLYKYGLNKNTIIIFTSDHGDMLGAHHLLEKRVMFEEALQVPFFIYGEGIKFAQHTYYEPINLIDVVPTVLDLLCIPIPEWIEGETLLPLLKGKKFQREAVFAEWYPRKRTYPNQKSNNILIDFDAPEIITVRTIDWKLNINKSEIWELYHLKRDPGETKNLIYDKKYSEIIRILTNLIKNNPAFNSRRCFPNL